MTLPRCMGCVLVPTDRSPYGTHAHERPAVDAILAMARVLPVNITAIVRFLNQDRALRALARGPRGWHRRTVRNILRRAGLGA